jgi:hypothetical protein
VGHRPAKDAIRSMLAIETSWFTRLLKAYVLCGLSLLRLVLEVADSLFKRCKRRAVGAINLLAYFADQFALFMC